MSKRGPGASFGGDEERYGASHDTNTMGDNEKPARATAAQMARRKIAQAKTAGRRSASPAVTIAPGGTPNPQFQVPTQSGFNFSFGDTNASFGQQPQQNGSSATFSFGQSNPTQQNNSSIFGQTTGSSFGTSFNSASSQPQQNGFTPLTSPAFSQSQSQSQQPSASTFQFGQTQSGLSNGTPANPGTGNIFKSFGQSGQDFAQNNNTAVKFGASQPEKQEPKHANVFAGFGQKVLENGDKPVFGSSLSQTSATPSTSNIFGHLNQPALSNGEKSVFGASIQKDTFKPSTPGPSSLFGDLTPKPLPNAEKPLFSTSQATQETPKPAVSNFFSNLKPQSQTNGDGPSSTVQQTPSTSLFNGFGQSQQSAVKSTAEESQTPKTSAFSGFGQTPNTQVKSSLLGASQAEQSTSKPSSNLFGSLNNQPQSNSPQNDTSMTTPDHTPQKPQKDSAAATSTPSTTHPPRSLFDRMDKEQANKLSRKSTNSIFPTESSAPSTGSAQTPLFTPSSHSVFGASVEVATPKATFEIAHPEPPKTAPAKSFFGQSASQSSTQRPLGSPSIGAQSASEPTPSAQRPGLLTTRQRKKLKSLNLSLAKHMQTQDPEQDWSEIFSFYSAQVAQIYSERNVKGPVAGDRSTTSVTSSTTKQTASSKTTKTLTGSSAATAQTPTSSGFGLNAFSKPPDTAPVQKKRLFEDDNDSVQPPATEHKAKRHEPANYPKLPESASKTAKLFEATLDKSKDAAATSFTSKSGFNPSTKPLFSTSAGQSSTAEASAPKSTAGFIPTFSASTNGGDMFAAFGKAAKAQEDKDRSKRKNEDYDSEDETAEEWEKRDLEEQQRKRAKIAEAATAGKGFVFQAPTSSNSTLGGNAALTETPKLQAKSFFGRSTAASPPNTAPAKPSLFAAQTPGLSNGAHAEAPATTAHASTSNIFGHLQSDSSKSNSNIFGFLRDNEKSSQLGEEAEKGQGSGDKTFKPDTPLKFGASANSTTPATAPLSKSTGLFGSLAPPAGSLGASRATTPGVTTDGEGSTATGADDATGEEQTDPQVEDQTALQPNEKKTNEVLFELGANKNALCKKYEEKGGSKEWVAKGKGPLYILKDKATGKVRIVLKIAPFGKLAMNYEPVKGIEYKILPGSGKIVAGAFFDHLHVSEPKLGQFTIQVKDPEDAKEIARILTEETPQ